MTSYLAAINLERDNRESKIDLAPTNSIPTNLFLPSANLDKKVLLENYAQNCPVESSGDFQRGRFE